MAETLGSLTDKLTIKNIRLEYLKLGKVKVPDLKEKIRIVSQQRDCLIAEIDDFLNNAMKGRVRLKELKVKLYNEPQKKEIAGGLGNLINELSITNARLWKLEDEVRKTGASDKYIVKTKRNIDVVNQKRNDLIDGIDGFLEKKIESEKH